MILRINIGGFVLSPALAKAVESLKEDRLFLRSTITVNEGGMAGAVEFLGNYSTPELLIIESSAKGEALFEELGTLADVCQPGTRVILIGAENDISLFKTLIDQGISQYFFGTPNDEDLRHAIAEAFADRSQNEKCHTIAVTGFRGGAGSSIIAHNVGSELARLYGDDVIIVDLDIITGTAALNFNLQPASTIVDALSQSSSIDEELLTRFLEIGEENVSVLASPGQLTTGVEISSSNLEAVMKVVKQMASYVILDVPHMWNSWVQDVLVDADDTIVVATPDLYNLRDGKNLIEFLSPHRGADAPIHLVLNRVGEIKKGEIKEKEFREVLAIAPTVSIPYEPEVFASAQGNGETIYKTSKRSKAAAAIETLAKAVSGKSGDEKGIGKSEKKSGFFSSLFKKK